MKQWGGESRPGVKAVWCWWGPDKCSAALKLCCCLKRHHSVIKLRPGALGDEVCSMDLWSVCHTWLLWMSSRLQSQSKHAASGLDVEWSMLIFFALRIYFLWKEDIHFWRTQSVKGIEIFTIKVTKCVTGKQIRSSGPRAAISAVIRVIEMPMECNQQKCSLILFALGQEAVVKVNS